MCNVSITVLLILSARHLLPAWSDAVQERDLVLFTGPVPQGSGQRVSASGRSLQRNTRSAVSMSS